MKRPYSPPAIVETKHYLAADARILARLCHDLPDASDEEFLQAYSHRSSLEVFARRMTTREVSGDA